MSDAVRSALAVLLLTVCAVRAAAQTVKLPAEVKADPGALVVIRAETDCPALQWLALDPGLQLIPADLLKDTRAAVGLAARAGRYRVLAYGAKGDAASPPAVCVVAVGAAPGPGPVPPTPPTPVPDPSAELRVLLVYEAQTPLSREQQAVLYSPELAAHLDRACVKDGTRPGWRLWDTDVVVTDREAAAMRELWAAAKPQVDVLPAVVVARGKAAQVHPLPATVKEAVGLTSPSGRKRP